MGVFGKFRKASASATAERVEAADAEELPPASLDGERGIPPVNQRSYQSRGQLIAIAGGVVLLLGLMWAVNRPTPAPKIQPNDPHASREQRFDEGSPSGEVAPPSSAAAAAASVLEPPKPPLAQDPIHVVPAIDGSGGPPNAAQGNRPLTPLEKRMQSKTVIYDARATRTAAANPQAIPGLPGLNSDGSLAPGIQPGRLMPAGFPADEGAAPSQPDTTASDENGVAAILRPTKLEGASAARLPDRTLMLARGKLVDCILDVAISTVVAGMTKCSLPRNVYGEDGKAVLLERGTELTGEYRSNLRAGQSRLGIVWARAKTPAGVIIELSSPATDSLGRAGVDGYVDNHFWERYGAAILLSSLDDALSLLVNRVDQDQVYIPPNTTRTGREAASVALEANIKIPPTIIKNQGEHVAVFVARDLDFRGVYAYRAAPLASNE